MADDFAERAERQQRRDQRDLIDIDDPDHVGRADMKVGGDGGQGDVGNRRVQRGHRQRGEDRRDRPAPEFRGQAVHAARQAALRLHRSDIAIGVLCAGAVAPSAACTTDAGRPTGTRLHDAYAKAGRSKIDRIRRPVPKIAAIRAISAADFRIPFRPPSDRLGLRRTATAKSKKDGRRRGEAFCTDRRNGAPRSCVAPMRACVGACGAGLWVALAAGDPRLSGHLSRPDAAVGRAHRHQSGGRWLQPQPSLGYQFPHRAGEPECRRGVAQHADRLRRRHPDRGRDRAAVFLDRGAHQYAVQGLYRRRQHPAAVRAAAGRGCGVGHSGFAQDRPDQHHVQMDGARLARRFLFAVGTGVRVRHLLRALRLHVHLVGAAQHGSEPGGGRRNLRRQRVRDIVLGDVPADHAGDRLGHAAVVHRDARHLRHSGGAGRADQSRRADDLYLQAHQLVAAALQHRGRGRDHPDGRDRRAGVPAAEGAERAQLHHRGRQGVPAAQPRSRALALVHLRPRHRLSAGRGGSADAGADRGGVPQIHVHPRRRQPVRHAAIFADAFQRHLRQSADACARSTTRSRSA